MAIIFGLVCAFFYPAREEKYEKTFSSSFLLLLRLLRAWVRRTFSFSLHATKKRCAHKTNCLKRRNTRDHAESSQERKMEEWMGRVEF